MCSPSLGKGFNVEFNIIHTYQWRTVYTDRGEKSPWFPLWLLQKKFYSEKLTKKPKKLIITKSVTFYSFWSFQTHGTFNIIISVLSFCVQFFLSNAIEKIFYSSHGWMFFCYCFKYVICLYISLFFRQADALKASITGKKGFYYQ